ncbi:MAG: MFS transporter [Chloroflexi bacterium]|nr:MFS transporter [Chloroflexota bacterium]
MLAQLTEAGSKLQAFDALRYTNYRWFWLGNLGQAAALGMQFLILGWLVLQLTGSSSQLGLVIFIYGAPNLVLLVFGGVFADRIDRRVLLISSQSGVTALICIVAVLTQLQLISVYHIYGVVFLLGVIQGINMPARMSIVPSLVNREHLLNAVALNTAVMNTGRIVGPAFAGWVIEFAGLANALFLNVFFYAVGVFFLTMIRGLPRITGPGRRNIIGDLIEGVRFLQRTPVALTIIGIGCAFGFFAAAYLELLPAFAREVLSANAGSAGFLLSAAGLGSLISSMALASAGDLKRKNILLIAAALTFGVALFAFAWSPIYSLSWAILVIAGFGFTGYISLGTTILQLTVPPQLLGRIMSFWLLGAALHYVGAWPLGLIADYLSWPISLSYGAIMFTVVVLILGVWRPTLRRLEL